MNRILQWMCGCMKYSEIVTKNGMRWLFCCCIALILVACGPALTVPQSEKPLKLLRIELEQNGAAIVLKQGEALRVTLPGDPKSGYFWEVDKFDKDILIQAGHAVFVPNTDPGTKGGFYYFTFSVAGSGICPLRIVYRHAHDRVKKPLKVFQVLVTITT